ncbi:hypothetical protein LZ30DRAFT_220651 [Colletotrichum cereale]|nr:hypothetical protein LZ30DRAFT_220651 [Colletotrichum cereale]
MLHITLLGAFPSSANAIPATSRHDVTCMQIQQGYGWSPKETGAAGNLALSTPPQRHSCTLPCCQTCIFRTALLFISQSGPSVVGLVDQAGSPELCCSSSAASQSASRPSITHRGVERLPTYLPIYCIRNVVYILKWVRGTRGHGRWENLDPEP